MCILKINRTLRKQLDAKVQRSAARCPTRNVIAPPSAAAKLASIPRAGATNPEPEPIVIDD